MNRRPKGLGRGLDALLGDSPATATAAAAQQVLPLARLQAGDARIVRDRREEHL